MTEKRVELLPEEVVHKDRQLSQAAGDLMELRWHWTLDESNASRISITGYARQVGVSHPAISRDANAWAAYLIRNLEVTPGGLQTPGDFREAAGMREERRMATEAVAAATGRTFHAVAQRSPDEVNHVLETARERAEERGTLVEHEIERAAQWRAKARKAAESEKDERRRAAGLRYIELEGLAGKAMQALRKMLDVAKDVELGDEETELLTKTLADLRALLGLLDLKITGATDVDWDAELERMVS
jgi:hypothetical protein